MNPKESGLGLMAWNTPSISKVIDIALEQRTKEIFDVFDECACIKDDKWYKELKEKFEQK